MSNLLFLDLLLKNEVGHLLLHCIGRKCLLVQICDKYCKKQYLQ